MGTLSVQTSGNTTVYGIDASGIAYDSVHNVLYVSATPTSPYAPGRVVPINMSRGAAGWNERLTRLQAILDEETPPSA